MTVTATAKRRRKQARNDYRHMAPMDRPHYPRHAEEVLNRRAQLAAERRKMIATRKGASKKK